MKPNRYQVYSKRSIVTIGPKPNHRSRAKLRL